MPCEGEDAFHTTEDVKTMIKIGDVCPLFFDPMGKYPFGTGCYTQKFHTSDHILLQVIADGGETVTGTLNNLATGGATSVSFSTYQQNDEVKVWYKDFTSLSEGVYSVTVSGIGESEPFSVESSDYVDGLTTRIRYSHKDNNSFDNVFWINDTQQFFDLRLECGFKPGGYLPQVSNEQYRNQRQEIVELYAMPYDQWQLTLGDVCGVPVWFLRLVNRILCLSHVEIGGRLWARSEQSVPEKVQVTEDSTLFQATVTLEPLENEVSGVGGVPEEATQSGVVAFHIDNPKDGQLLQFSDDTSSFENVTTVRM